MGPCARAEADIMFLPGVALGGAFSPPPCVFLPVFFALGGLVLAMAAFMMLVSAREVLLTSGRNKALFVFLLGAFASVAATVIIFFAAPQFAFVAWAVFTVFFAASVAFFGAIALAVMTATVHAKSSLVILGGPLKAIVQLSIAVVLGAIYIACAIGMAVLAHAPDKQDVVVILWRVHCASLCISIPLMLVLGRSLLLKIGFDLRRMIPANMIRTRMQAESILKRLNSFYIFEFYLNSLATPAIFLVHAITLPGFSFLMFVHILNALFFLANIFFLITPNARGFHTYIRVITCCSRRHRSSFSTTSQPLSPPLRPAPMKIESILNAETEDSTHPAVLRFQQQPVVQSASQSTLSSRDVESAVVVSQIRDVHLLPERRVWKRVADSLQGRRPPRRKVASVEAEIASTAQTFVEVVHDSEAHTERDDDADPSVSAEPMALRLGGRGSL